MSQFITETVTVQDKEITIETGRMAKQASGSVVMRIGDSMLLVTAVNGGHKPDARFFPLVVDYVEKGYAGGQIPGGFFKREGRLGAHEILTSRLTDRPIRPLFPDGYKGDTQIVATVLSHDGENESDVLCITGASAALMLSDSPFLGPIAGIRIGRVNGELIANPTNEEREESDMDIILACSRDAIVMVEGEADGVSEEDMLDALDFGFESAQPLIEVQRKLASLAGKEKEEFVADPVDTALVDRVREVAKERLANALVVPTKMERYAALDAAKAEVVAELSDEFEGREDEIKNAFSDFKRDMARAWAAKEKKRIDGRDPREVRDISIDVGLLPRVHGSALFTRGETQALVALTLGTERDQQIVETLSEDRKEPFLLHYNFPPFSVGEVKMLRGPGRREIGHGMLAHRALSPVLPDHSDEFPYTIRLVSEVLESNGSSSMATVCGGSLALMDGGVPISDAVAGIAMGLIKEGDDYVVLSDILGDEDHLGDMDFKVAGTENGITALQMDIKITGLSRAIMEEALHQAREGRLHILRTMNDELRATRPELSPHAPRITTINIPVDRIRDVIGSGGKTIRGIQERTGCSINVEDDGTVKVASADEKAAQEAVDIIKALTQEPVVGEIYLGTVAKVVDFGAFVTILPGTDGLCHISEMTEGRVDKVEDVVREGEEIVVKCIGVERNGKIRLSRKDALGKEPTVVANKIDL